jgi:flagellar motor switch protein FliM
MLEPIRKILYSGVQADRSDSDNRWLAHLTEQLDEADVELIADLGQASVQVRELLQLQPGDVIPLDMPERVVARVDGVPVLECWYGVINGHYGLKVQRISGAGADPNASEG